MRLRWLFPILLLAECMLRTSPANAGEVRIPIGPFSGGYAITASVQSLKEMHDEGVVRQRLDFSCGAAATATILTSYLGEPCTEQEIIEYIVAHSNARELIMRQGFSLLDLKKYAESKGIQATGYRLTFELLASLKQPVLLPLLGQGQTIRHFVVFFEAEGEKVYLADPSVGRRVIARAEFEQQWDLKIGMVFAKPGKLTLPSTALTIRPVDRTTLYPSTVLTVALPTSIFHNRVPTEF